MNLTTKFMGLTLRNPLMIASSSLTDNPKKIRQLEADGAGAVVLKSLFEEQIIADKNLLIDQDEMYFWYPEAVDYVSGFSKEHGINQYLELIKNAKKEVEIPVLGNINCISTSEWPAFSEQIQTAGVDGLELNVQVPFLNTGKSSAEIEDEYFKIIRELKKHISIPLSVKIGFYFTNLEKFVEGLQSAGADAIVFFNRFYRPDINIETQQVTSRSIYSSPAEITLSLRFVALFSRKLKIDLSAATGIHDGEGLIKQILAGANTVQVCSTLYKNGTSYLQKIHKFLENWMQRHNYVSVNQFRGLVAEVRENETLFERLQYMKKTTGVL